MSHRKRMSAYKILIVDANPKKLKELGYGKLDFEEFSEYIKGKETYIELLVILKLLGVIHDIEIYDENFRTMKKGISSCFRIKKRDGSKIFIEVKKTPKEQYTISNTHIEKRFKSVEKESEPLFFAVSMCGYWGLFTPEYLESKRGLLELKDFVGEESTSCFESELNTCSYMFEQKLCIKETYSKISKDGLGIYKNDIGELILYELYIDDTLVLTIDNKNSLYYAYQFVLEGLQSFLRRYGEVVLTNGVKTIVSYSTHTDDYVIIPEYKFILPCVLHMYKDEYKEHFSHINNTTKKRVSCFCTKSIQNALYQLAKLGIEIIVFRDSRGYPIEKFKEKFWREDSHIK